MNKIKNGSQGFTLLELLVVVLIIGILAGIALPQYRTAVAKAELTKIISAVKVIQSAQERYYLLNNSYAKNFDYLDVEVPAKDITCYVSSGRWCSCYSKNYGIAHYYSQDNAYNQTECFAKNEKSAKPCKDFLGKEGLSTDSEACNFIGGKPCWRVVAKMPM